MKKFWVAGLIIWVAFLIICVALVTRFYQLGNLPGGLTWDEAAIAYNGFSILETHRDEWLNLMPVSFKSFGDYKAPLAIYLNSIFTYYFGLDPWAIRLPFALAGVLSVIGMMLLAELVWRLSLENKTKTKTVFFSSRTVGLIAGGVIALSPWHVLFSRVGFESGLALTELIWGVYFFFLWLKSQSSKPVGSMPTDLSLIWLVLTIGLLASTFYTYHSAKVAMPLMIGLLFYWSIKNKHLNFKHGLSFGLPFLGLLWLFFKDAFFGEGLTRAGVTIVAEYGLSLKLLTTFLINVWAHLSPEFLVLGQTDSLRHSTGVWGVLLPTTYVFWLIGLGATIKNIWLIVKQKTQIIKLPLIGYLGLGWTVFGLLPAMIGVEVPHPNRALLALPGFILLGLVGWETLFNWLKQRLPKLINNVIIILVVLHLLLAGLFMKTYLTTYQSASSEEFLAGYLEVAQVAWQYLDGTDQRLPVNQVIMTSQYGQPYIFVLLAGQINPMAYHNGALISFLFPDEATVADLSRKNALVIAKPGTFGLEPSRATQIIYDDYGNDRFWLYVTEEE